MKASEMYPKEMRNFKAKYFPFGVSDETAEHVYVRRQKILQQKVDDIADGLVFSWDELRMAGLELWLAREILMEGAKKR